MNTEDTISLFDLLKDNNHCLLYNGSFVDAITTKVIELSEVNLVNRSEVKKVQKRVSHLTAECFQNIIRHGGYKDDDEKPESNTGFFMSLNNKNRYYIASGNLITNHKVEDLKGRLDQLNASTDEELKQLHRNVITHGNISDKGGAGLGLIDMARKSGNKFSYKFEKYDNLRSLFYNLVNLKSEVEGTITNDADIDVSFSISLHHKMIEQNILMVHKGDLSKASVIPLLHIIQNNFEFQHSNTQLTKSIFEILAELLHNISRHGYSVDDKTQGIFIIAKNKDTFTLSTGNYIENHKIETLNNQLFQINNMTDAQLEDLFLNKLEEGSDINSTIKGTGLIDIARHLQNKIEYQFTNINNQLSFFSLSLNY